jgi:hypothetical protein
MEETAAKQLRRDSVEYQEIKVHKASYNDGIRRLFLNLPNWRQLSRAFGVLNVPTELSDRLKVQADVKRKLKT